MKKSSEIIISLKDINKSFPLELGGEQQVLFDINFTVKSGEFVAIMGASGSGKSASMRNFKGSELGVINVANKPLPFKSDINTYNTDRYEVVEQLLKKASVKSIVIDDSQYLMANEFMRRAKETGYQKYTDLALDFRNLIHNVNYALPDDVIVYFLHHTETDQNTGKVKAKTVGKMIDQYLTLEGCFDIVLLADVDSDGHHFITQSDGYTTAKSPEGMFPSDKIENNLGIVDKAVREYWGL